MMNVMLLWTRRIVDAGVLTLFFLGVVYFAYYATMNLVTTAAYSTVVEYTPVVVQGNDLIINWKIERRWSSCSIQVDRYLTTVDGSVYPLSYTEKFREQSEIYNAKVHIPIPGTIPAGFYMYNTRASYYCNALHYVFGPARIDNTPISIQIVEHTPQQKT